jgi:hypothetical protein
MQAGCGEARVKSPWASPNDPRIGQGSLRGDDLIEALDWINRELDKGVVVPSDNARTRREILLRQKAELEARP